MRSTLVGFFVVGLGAFVFACGSGGASESASSEEALAPGGTIRIIGSLAYGQTSDPVAYSAKPTYYGFTFSGHAGDAVTIGVVAAGEDAYAWLLDANGHALASDTKLGTVKDTHQAHLTATLPGDALYTIAFREAHREPTTFTVALAGTPACHAKTCADLGANCGGLADGCGGTLDCGSCTGTDTCGGAGQPNRCGGPPPPPPPACTWQLDFSQRYGQAWNPAEVAFVTSDGAVHRGMSALDLEASRNQVPDIVKTLGSSANVTEVRLYGAGGGQNVLASHAGPYVYGLGDAMWHQVNGYAPGDFVETTLLRLFTEPEHAYAELKEYFRTLFVQAEYLVPANDLADYRTANHQLMAAVDSGALVFKLGTGHGIDFWQTRQVVNGKAFSFQFSDAVGLDPKIGMQREGAWIQWPTTPVAPVCR